MKGNELVGYKYEGCIHCLSCARKRFGRRLNLPDMQDREGNPLEPIYAANDEYQGMFCDDCAEPLGE